MSKENLPERNAMVGHVLAYGSEEDRYVKFRASTPMINRHGYRVLPLGIDTENFDKNPVFLWGHDGYESYAGPPKIESVIGKVVSYSKTAEAFDIKVEFTDPATNPNGEKALRMVRGGFLNTVSIGFYGINAGWELEDEEEVFVYRDTELLEVSLVPIPANPDAVALSNAIDKILGITPPPRGADVGATLRKFVDGLKVTETVRSFMCPHKEE